MAETKTAAKKALSEEAKRKIARNPMTLRQQKRMNKEHGVPMIRRKGVMRDRDPEA